MALGHLENFTGWHIPQENEEDLLINGNDKWVNILQGDGVICIAREHLKDFIKALKEIEKTT
jgi:hypothetical protein